MPIYEYHCNECHQDFEELVFGTPSHLHCPRCNGANIQRILSVCGFKSGTHFTSSSASSSCGSCSSGSCSSCK